MPRMRRQESPAPAPDDDDDDVALAEVDLQSRWTGGSLLATRLATVVLWAALLAGPAALVLALLQAGPGGQLTRVAAPVADPVGEQAAVGEFAQRFVVTWLQSTRGQETQLAPYVRTISLTLPEVAWVADQPATADLRRADGAGTWSVLVGVTVTTPRTAGPPVAGALPVRRYFRVPVRYRSGAVVALALPAAVAAPAAGEAPQLTYRYHPSLDGPVASSVQEFLSALLTGAGDVTRLVTPGSDIAAVLPAPYTRVEVTDVLVDRDLASGPRSRPQGERLRALVDAVAAAGPRQQISVQYALTLTSRAGRWEVTALDPTPAAQPQPPRAADASGGPVTAPAPPSSLTSPSPAAQPTR